MGRRGAEGLDTITGRRRDARERGPAPLPPSNLLSASRETVRFSPTDRPIHATYFTILSYMSSRGRGAPKVRTETIGRDDKEGWKEGRKIGGEHGSAPTHYHTREGRINKESHLEEMGLFGVLSPYFLRRWKFALHTFGTRLLAMLR